MIDRRSFLLLAAAAAVRPGRVLARQQAPGHHVYPTGSIQEALEAAAGDATNKTVYVHAGTYRPSARGQALIWLNARHDGITLEAVGDVTLTAANPAVADRRSAGWPRSASRRRRLRA